MHRVKLAIKVFVSSQEHYLQKPYNPSKSGFKFYLTEMPQVPKYHAQGHNLPSVQEVLSCSFYGHGAQTYGLESYQQCMQAVHPHKRVVEAATLCHLYDRVATIKHERLGTLALMQATQVRKQRHQYVPEL